MRSYGKTKASLSQARAWGVQRASRNGSQYAHGEEAHWTRQCTSIKRLGCVRAIPSPQIQTGASCTRYARCNLHDISSAAWNNRQEKRKAHLRDFRHEESGEGLCYKKYYKPTWVDEQLATLDARMGNLASAICRWSLFSDLPDQLGGPVSDKSVTPESVRSLCQQGRIEGAVEALEVLVGMNTGVDKCLLYSVLKECVLKKDLMLGGQVHALAVKMGLGSDTFLCNHFIRMYAGHGKLQEAMDVFRGVALPDAFMWSSIISAHVKQGQAEHAIKLYQGMRARRMVPDGYVLVAALQACAAAGDLVLGKQIHHDVLNSSIGHDIFVYNCLVDMYAKCGSLTDARRVFDSLSQKDVVTWNAMIAAYAKVEGMGQEALSLYSAMHVGGMAAPDALTFVGLLQACANVGVSALEKGKQLHSRLKDRDFESDVVVGGSLVHMYVKCGSLQDARIVFDGLTEKNVVTWTAMISGYAQQEAMGREALSLYNRMNIEGRAAPNAVTFLCLLQACANVGVPALETGKQLHSVLKTQRLERDMVLGRSLVNMYAKCGSLEDARRVFDNLSMKDVVTWNAMIAGYAKADGMGQEALALYNIMQNEGIVAPDAVTFIGLLQACANVGMAAAEKGKQVHSQLEERKLESDVVVGGSLVNMYVKCGNLKGARVVFDELVEKNVVAWNAMIAGYAQQEGMNKEAFSLFHAMRCENLVAPDAVTFVSLLHACANVGVAALDMGKQLHTQLKDRKLESHVVVGGSLVNMYVKCGSLTDARMVFDGLGEKNVVTWNAMTAGYAQQEGMAQEAFRLYSAMQNEGMAAPDPVTYVCLLQACSNLGVSALEKGKQLHSQLKHERLESDKVVGGSLVNMYAKCGSLGEARSVFDRLSKKDVVTWTAMIAGYAKAEGMGQEALELYTAMDNEGMAAPDAVTFVCLLQACGNVGPSALKTGKQLHSELKDRKLESDVVVGGSLVNMYVKCGSLEDARVVFDGLGEKNVVTWNAMIGGYAQQEGMSQEALNMYNTMQKEGIVTPDAVTYICLAEACASVGALQQGTQLHSEIRDGGFEFNVLIATCLVKMYAKCGCLEVSREVFDRLPRKDSVTWTALLKVYAEHGDGAKAMQCFEEMLKQGVQPDDVTYTCLFTACSHAGLVDQGQMYFETMLERHGVEPNNWHFNCMVDLLGRSGHLDRAEQMLRASGLAGSAVSWKVLLSACKSYGDAELGRRCFDHLLNLEPTVATPYVLLGSIYANAGRWGEADKVERLRIAAGARKMPAKACIEVRKEIHEFTVGEERSDVAATLRKMNATVKDGGHVAHTQLVVKAVSEKEKEDALCGHAEKLALAYGLLHTPPGSTLVVTKNLRMCNDCHSSTKIMSRLENREIVVRDGHKVHRFQNGSCSCQDRP